MINEHNLELSRTLGNRISIAVESIYNDIEGTEHQKETMIGGVLVASALRYAIDTKTKKKSILRAVDLVYASVNEDSKKSENGW